MPVPVRCCRDRCIVCEHPTSATSYPALQAAIVDHVDYVNTVLPRTIDAHFEETRREALLDA